MARFEPTLRLFTKESGPVRFDTKWEDIHEESKKLLLSLEERILEYREESEKLEQSADLNKYKIYEENFELVAARITQELREITSAITRNNASLEALQTIKAIMQNTEIAVGSYKRLIVSVSAVTATVEESCLATDDREGQYKTPDDQKLVRDFYGGLPNKPSPFLQHTVVRFEQQLEEYRQQVRKIDQLLCDSDMDAHRGGDGRSQTQGASFLNSLHATMQNSHSFFMHVAAQVELLHQDVERMRGEYLANLRRRGINKNPFLEADRREELKREIEARRVHPTLHTLNLPSREASRRGIPIPQPVQQINSLLYGSCGLSSGSTGAHAEPFGSPIHVNAAQVHGIPVASNWIHRPAPLQIPSPNNDGGAAVMSSQIPRSRPAPLQVPGRDNNEGAGVISDQISRQGPLQISVPNYDPGAGEPSPSAKRVKSRTGRKRP